MQHAASRVSTWNVEEVAGFQRSEASDELKVPSSDRHTFPSAYLLSHVRIALVQLQVCRPQNAQLDLLLLLPLAG